MSSRAPRLLVLGGGHTSLPVLRALRALGCHLTVADGMPDAPGFRCADAGLFATTSDPEAAVDAARAYASHAVVDGVLGTARPMTAAVAAVRDALGLAGTSLEAARRVADRPAMKTRLRAAGVPVPWSAIVRGPAALRQIVAAARTPLVVKPADGWAARGVVRLLQGVDLAWAHRVALLASPTDRAVVEAYVSGRQLSIVALVSGDDVTCVDVAERSADVHERFAPFVIDAGRERPAVVSADERRGIDVVLGTAAAALGLGSGVVTAEIVLAASGPMLVDLQLGLADGRRLVHEIPLATGVDVVEAALRLALGETPPAAALTPRWTRPVATRALFSTPGTVIVVEDAEVAAHADGVTLVDVLVGPGSRVLPPTSNLCHGGAVVAVGEGRGQASARAAAAAASIHIVTRSDPAGRAVAS